MSTQVMLNKWDMALWGVDYPLFKQAVANYPTDGFYKTIEQHAQRMMLIHKYMQVRRNHGLT